MDSATAAPLTISIQGFEAVVEAFAYDEQHHTPALRAISIVGRPTLIKSVVSNLFLHNEGAIGHLHRISIPIHPFLPMTHYQRRLPSGLVSSLLIPKAATRYSIAVGEPAFLIQRSDSIDEIPASFGSILDRLVPYPILPEWLSALWQLGHSRKWIRELPGHNIRCFVMSPNIKTLRDEISTQLKMRHLPVLSKAA